jgi:hypothetical protein
MNAPHAHRLGVLTFAAVVWSLAAWPCEADDAMPIVFARSGREATVRVPPMEAPVASIVLRAFGRTWTKPAGVKESTATVDVPTVRVPTVFAVIDPAAPKTQLAELVAYPDRDIAWKNNLAIYAADAPVWFRQWADAVGLPVSHFTLKQFQASTFKPAGADEKRLLILGNDASGKQFQDAQALGQRKGMNLLVLEADWFGRQGGKVAVLPKHLAGGLASLAEQKWPKPLTFTTHRKPWPGISNRWSWVVDEKGLPCVEEVMFIIELDDLGCLRKSQLTPEQRTILSYLPWQQQLGCNESADTAFTRLLVAAADVAPHRAWRFGTWASPDSTSRRGLERRPVLEKMMPLPAESLAKPMSVIQVVDLRGQTRLNSKLLYEDWRPTTDNRGMLILGDDGVLDQWKRLEFDRAKKRFGCGRVTWMPDDKLPASADQQIHLMMTLSKLGVALATPSWEQEKNND